MPRHLPTDAGVNSRMGVAVERCHEAQFVEETRQSRKSRAYGRTDTDRAQGARRQTGDGANASLSFASTHLHESQNSTTGDAAASLRDSICKRLGPGPAHRYFGKSTDLGIQGNRVTVRVPNGFLADQIERRFGATLDELARQAGADSVAIEVAQQSSAAADQLATGSSRSDSTSQPTVCVRAGEARRAVESVGRGSAKARSRGGFPAHHRFTAFVVGKANRVAFEAARRTAWQENPGGLLLIHGPCGVGKTHLLHAIASEFRARHPGGRVRVTSGERFIREFVTSVRNRTVEAFQRRHRELDLLCIDDVHAVAGKEKTQIELVQTLNALGSIRAQIALISDEAPKQIDAIGSSLSSRLSGGLVVRLDPPDQELRTRITRAVSDRRRLPMSDAVCRVIAEGSVTLDGTIGGVRELEGLIAQTEAIWKFEGGGIGSIGIETAARAISARGGSKPAVVQTGPIPIRSIVATACREIGVELGELTGRTKVRRVVLARSLAVLVARRHTNLSFPEIARAMQRTNHSTVITQFRAIQTRASAGDPITAGTPLDGLTVDQAADRIAIQARRLG